MNPWAASIIICFALTAATLCGFRSECHDIFPHVSILCGTTIGGILGLLKQSTEHRATPQRREKK